MKKNKGFTLIELLSIIVILAIIAGITVPIVLNIIDNSRKSTAKISAVGFKDSINKFYYTGIVDNSFNTDDLTGSFDINKNVLINTAISSNTYTIPISGNAPDGGNIDIVKGDLIRGCIQIKEYAVVFDEENVSKVEKGECIDIIDIYARQLLYSAPDGLTDTDVANVQQALDDLYSKLD